MHNQVHVSDYDNGHEQSIDCWCEPTQIIRQKNRHGIDVLIVYHNDYTPYHRAMVLADRRANFSLPFLGQFVDHPQNQTPHAPWVSRLLNPFGNPPLLPPHDPNERSL